MHGKEIFPLKRMQFKSHVTFRYRENTANAKSVLSVLGACIKSGDEIELVCEGEDEKGNFICSEGYCSVCEDYATRMLCKVITE